MRTTKKLIWWGMILLVLTSFNVTSAQPVPLGIEGKVYHLDFQTEVFEGVAVIVENLNTSEKVIGYTGKGTPGRFSFAFNWSKNDWILVRTANPISNDSTSLVLSGVIRNIELGLNMNLPNLPPNITSAPVIEALENVQYSYQVTAFDWNQNPLTYSLALYPENMSISAEGLITWTPTRDQHGLNNVTVNVSDEHNYSLQSFQIEVLVENTHPNILSTPKKNVLRGQLYTYEMIVDDEDPNHLSYEVFRGAPGMYFEDNILRYTPGSDDEGGTYIIILDVYDRFDVRTRQIFFLTVDEPAPVQGPRGGSNMLTIPKSSSQEPFKNLINTREFLINDASLPITKIIIDKDEELLLSIRSAVLNETVPSIPTRVFKYLEILSNKDVDESVEIYFSVDVSWLSELSLELDEVVLAKYVNNSWITLPTEYLDGDDSKLNYKALSQGLSLFAITHNENATTTRRPVSISSIESVYSFTGRVYFTEKVRLTERELQKLKDNLEIVYVNRATNKTFTARILYLEELIYQSAVYGEEKDEVTMQVQIGGELIFEEELTLQDFVTNKDIVLDYDLIKKYIKSKNLIYIALGVVVLVALFFLYKTNRLLRR